jgi:hypothetical protein
VVDADTSLGFDPLARQKDLGKIGLYGNLQITLYNEVIVKKEIVMEIPPN